MSSTQDPHTPDDRVTEDVRPAQPAAEATFRSDDLLCDRFRVVRFIARGGMGELYEAEDLALGERVALKTIRPEIAADERVNQRFRREVQLARKVTHPNICRIFDLFQHQPASGDRALPVSFVTMELLDGETLSQCLKREGRLSVERARPLLAQMAAALSAAHAVGVVHRDFKSTNVMLLRSDRPGEPPRVVVTDFGLAYSIDASLPAGTISHAGELIGTPDYMAPEQIDGSPVTPATDIYALGVVTYEMVTGLRPFTADSPVAAAMRRISGPPAQPPREIVPDLPLWWDRAIMRCLARYPQNRFSSATAMVDALDGGSRRWTRDRQIVAIAAGVVLLFTTAVGVSRLWQPSPGGVRSNGQQSAAESAVEGSASGAMNVAPRPAVAVLGFRNLAGRADTQWLSVALAEMLTTELGAGEALRTIPGETINRMKMELALADADSYASETLSRIRENLDSDLVVSGSYVTLGQGRDTTLRLDIRLQDLREGHTVSVVSETGRASELFDLVSRAGRQMRERLRVDAAPEAMAAVRASQPASPEAARLYAEGLTRLRRFDALGARELLERAIQIDPKFPLAHSALASTWSALGYDNRAHDAAARAFQLSDNLARADRLLVEGTYREMANEWKEAIAIWQTLATFFPDDVEHVLRLANAQITSGAPKEGLASIEEFRKRFPAVPDARLDLAEASAAETLSDFRRMGEAAASAVATGQAQGARLLVAAAKLREGGATLRQGQPERAAVLFEESRRMYADAGDRAGVARAMNNLASALIDGTNRQRGVALYEEGLAIARAIGEQDLVARFLNNLAIQRRRAGDLQASLRMNRESLAIRREIGDRTNIAVSLNNIGNVLLDLGDLKGASHHYEQSADMSREMGDRRAVARALHNAAESLKLQGQLVRARTTTEEALRIRRTIDDPASVATSLFGLGHVAATQGDLPTARKSLAEALQIDRQLNRERPIAYTLFVLGEIALLEGDFAAARRQHQEALDLRIRLGEKGTAAESQTALAVLALEQQRPADAEALAREAAGVFAQQETPDNEGTARAVLALALMAQNQRGPAEREAERARSLVQRSQNVLAKLPVAIAAARVQGTSSPSRALPTLESVRNQAAERGIARYEFEARRAIAEVEARRSSPATPRLAALHADAKARGFGLYTR